MKKMIFELLVSPLSISDNYFVNSIVITLIGFVAFKVAFKLVGDIGASGGIGSLLHWTIRFIAFFLLWFSCCIVIIIARFIVKNIVLLSFLLIGLVLFYLVGKFIFNRVFSG